MSVRGKRRSSPIECALIVEGRKWLATDFISGSAVSPHATTTRRKADLHESLTSQNVFQLPTSHVIRPANCRRTSTFRRREPETAESSLEETPARTRLI